MAAGVMVGLASTSANHFCRENPGPDTAAAVAVVALGERQ